jgi:hypothetical protein
MLKFGVEDISIVRVSAPIIPNTEPVPPGAGLFLFDNTAGWDAWLAITTAGSLVVGRQYIIITSGNTNWVAIGAANNNVGTKFTTTGAGSGTGTAQATVESLDTQDQSGATQHAQTNFYLAGPNPAPGTYPRVDLATPGQRGGTTTDLICQYGTDLGGANQTVSMLTRPKDPYLLGKGSALGEYTPLNAKLAFRFWFKISQYNGMAGQAGWKFFEMWRPDGIQRTQLSFLTLTDPTASLCMNYDSTGAVGLTPFGASYNLPTINDNTYHKLTLLRKSQTGTNGDGYTQVWIDGFKMLDISQAAVGITPPGGSKVWCTQAEVNLVETQGCGAGLRLGEVLNGSGGNLFCTFSPIQAWQVT